MQKVQKTHAYKLFLYLCLFSYSFRTEQQAVPNFHLKRMTNGLDTLLNSLRPGVPESYSHSMHLKGKHTSVCSSLYTQTIYLPLKTFLCHFYKPSSGVWSVVMSVEEGLGLPRLTSGFVGFCSPKHHHGCKQGQDSSIQQSCGKCLCQQPSNPSHTKESHHVITYLL